MKLRILFLAAVAALIASPAHAMHISEGILPAKWAALWYAAALPFVVWGLRDLRAKSAVNPQFKPLVGLVGAAVFVFSCMPIPVPTAGVCSHPVGTGLTAILIGAPLAVVVTSIALLLQALFLAHGGLTTLGANMIAMGVAGGFAGYFVFKTARKAGASWWIAAFLAGLFSDWATYAMTSFELASALHGQASLADMFLAILTAFTPTQLPLGILEGVATAGALGFIRSRRPELMAIFAKGGAQ